MTVASWAAEIDRLCAENSRLARELEELRLERDNLTLVLEDTRNERDNAIAELEEARALARGIRSSMVRADRS